MREAEDIIFDELEMDSDGKESFYRYKEVEKAIKIAQKEAQNEAIDKCADVASKFNSFYVDESNASAIKSRILKLKK